MSAALSIRVDDLKGPEIRALLEEHLAQMHADSPPESVHALDLDRLRQQLRDTPAQMALW